MNRVLQFQGEHKESLYWGTYRPQVYLGIRARYHSACLFNSQNANFDFSLVMYIYFSYLCYSTTVLTFWWNFMPLLNLESYYGKRILFMKIIWIKLGNEWKKKCWDLVHFLCFSFCFQINFLYFFKPYLVTFLLLYLKFFVHFIFFFVFKNKKY